MKIFLVLLRQKFLEKEVLPETDIYSLVPMGCMNKLTVWASSLLVVGGLLLGVPQLYRYMSFGGAPWFAVLIGWASVLVAVLFVLPEKKK